MNKNKMKNICYLCGQKMVTKDFYNQNKNQFTTEPRFNHNEHIIQNALHGRLKPNNILCEQCGNGFSSDIDKDFVSIFQLFTERAKDYFINKDHGKDSKNTLKGYLFDLKDPNRKTDVQIRNNIVTPKHPFYKLDLAQKKVSIYANKTRAKQYQSVVVEELKSNKIEISKLTFEVIEDISSEGMLGIFFSKGIENFHDKFTLGFCKIAVGFATYNGIDREQMPKTLKIDQNGKGQLINKYNVFPFFPLGPVDAQLELNRHILENNYPTHTIILFSQKFDNESKCLFCYIDLFSTFQYYVLLNDNYKGEDVYGTYYQALLKQNKEKVNIRKVKQKYINIIIDDFQIDVSKYKGSKSDTDAYLDFLQKEVDNYTEDPKLDLFPEIKNMLEVLILKDALLNYEMNQDQISENLKGIPKGQKKSFIEELYFYRNNNNFGDKIYRNIFIEDDGFGNSELMSSPLECLSKHLTEENKKAYCTLKFHQLSQWISDINEII